MTDSINLDLVDQVVSVIPAEAWPVVNTALINVIVDNMPSAVLEQLTNDPCGFDEAQNILTNYYSKDGYERELIIDSFKILGDEYVCSILDSLELHKHVIHERTGTSLQSVQDGEDASQGIS